MQRVAALLLLCSAYTTPAHADPVMQAVDACQTNAAVPDAAAALRAEGFRNFSESDGETYLEFVAAHVLLSFLEAETSIGVTEEKASFLKEMVAEEQALASQRARVFGERTGNRSNLISPEGDLVVLMLAVPGVEADTQVTSCSINATWRPEAETLWAELTSGRDREFRTSRFNPKGGLEGGVLTVTRFKAAPYEAFYNRPYSATLQIDVLYSPFVPSS